MNEVKALIEGMGQAFKEFKSKNDERLKKLELQTDAIETAVAKGVLPGGGKSQGAFYSAAAAEHRDKFFAWARKGTDPDGLRGLEVRAELSTVDDPNGGFTVPLELDRKLDKLATDTVAMRRLAQKTTASGDYKRLLSSGGSTGGWTGERDERTVTDTPELKQFNPPWSELYMLPEVTQALLDDSAFDLESWLLNELQDVETTMEGTAFISGNGVKKPKGILAYETVANASWTWGKIGYVASGNASLLSNADKLRSLKHALKPAYRRNGVWLMTDSTQEVISNFKDGNGNYIWRAGLTDDAPDTLLGRPVEIDDNLDEIGADKYPIAFADWNRAYLIGDHKVGRRLLRDPFTRKGWVRFYLTKRLFGGVINHQAIKFLKITVA
jgi:HK97 family phage major capsid protein